MENECTFITERGMVYDMKLKILNPYDLQNVILHIKEDDIIFCKTDYLQIFALASDSIKNHSL